MNSKSVLAQLGCGFRGTFQVHVEVRTLFGLPQYSFAGAFQPTEQTLLEIGDLLGIETYEKF